MAARRLRAIPLRGTGAAGLATPAARWAMVFVWVTGVVRGQLEGVFATVAPALVGAHLAVLAGAILLTDRRDGPLARGRGAAVAAIALAATIAAVAATGTAADVWLLDFSAFLLALMLARGGVVAGGAGGAAQIVVVVGWAVATGQASAGTATMLAIPVLSYVLGVVWLVVLRGIVRAERAHRSETACAEREGAAAHAAGRRYERERQEVRAAAEPILRALRDGEPIDPAMTARVSVVEGAIRDRTFAPGLCHPVLAVAVAAARSRGVSVALLADDADGAGVVTDGAAARLARLVDAVTVGGVVIGVDSADPAAVTIVTRGGAEGRTTLRDAVRAPATTISPDGRRRPGSG